ncbi:MAG: metallopeptidase TldD-related protein [Candidatus Binatia bacterium]|nr:metallopeptidase TldD-related protein [Candidatus Binatia bacterium]
MRVSLAEVAELALESAAASGATAADVVAVRGRELQVGVRRGSLEKVTQAEEKRLGLRVFIGCRSAVASTSDLTSSGIREFAAATCALAKVVVEDRYAGLPEEESLTRTYPNLELFDPQIAAVTPEEARAIAERAEESALAYDPRIVNSEGAECSVDAVELYYASTAGFRGSYKHSLMSISVVPVAKGTDGMQRDYWYSVARRRDRLAAAEEVGRRAAERALRRLDARRVATCQVPVVFDPETAASLLGHLAQAVVGQSIHRGTSFLAGRLGESIAPSFVNIIDDGRIPLGIGSKPFDAEGVGTGRTCVVEEGYLRSYLLDTYAARRLGFARSTGNASRAVSSAPAAAPTNLFLCPGSVAPEEIIRSVSRGFYVTNLIGFGVNLTTGDYSRGASGIWIENGELTFPVEGVTIAGNLRDMLAQIEAVGSDLELRRSVAAPTLLIGRLTVAGSG